MTCIVQSDGMEQTSGPGEVTSGLLVPAVVPCPAGHLEWDRGHEALDAIVRLETADALIITEVHDLWPQAGCRWLSQREVLAFEEFDLASADIRVLDALGARALRAEPALGDLRLLLERLRHLNELVAVYTARTGSDECLVGFVSEVRQAQLTLDEVSPDGGRTGERLDYQLGEVIGVDWGTDYLRALSLLQTES